ncbi:protein-serine O-palmitoleoyltransferase porcupine isoform X1 [Topomyia yanbarensis]|uniref:protein-serine O-palmitoleoyltransferase porcupine isoform X1 n=1 Tax=Topomyia yanbarensis TaxID=2498891 RepID=UPI00273AC856|nr:protein-serine O-palmitoleoyltransferase porcupine isoform X1 [Topomyia yanbarensis]
MFVVQRIVSLGHGLPSVNIFQSLVHANNTFKLNTVYFGQVAINTTCSILSLLLANCAFAFLITDNSWKWIAAYSAAFSFRMSHYFVSYLSQATMVSAGYISNENSNQKSNAAKHVRFFGYIVILPWDVEFPRSLVHVVVAWNVPMHCFLKQYVFRILKPYGTFLAVFLTYVISSVLHGLNFQLWATLLTIGAWSYVEYNLRRKLAQIFSACVTANKCTVPCKRHKESKTAMFSAYSNLTAHSWLCFLPT